jgi:hypothetical protein
MAPFCSLRNAGGFRHRCFSLFFTLNRETSETQPEARIEPEMRVAFSKESN